MADLNHNLVDVGISNSYLDGYNALRKGMENISNQPRVINTILDMPFDGGYSASHMHKIEPKLSKINRIHGFSKDDERHF